MYKAKGHKNGLAKKKFAQAPGNSSKNESGDDVIEWNVSDTFSKESDARIPKEESEHEDDDTKEMELEKQLADIPFEKLQKMRSDGRERTFSIFRGRGKLARANKNRPMEMSSKKPVGRYREVVQAPKQVVRDPRFESLCGDYDQSRFRKLYSFIFEEELPRERQKLQKMLKSNKDDQSARETERHLSWIDNQLKRDQESKKRSEKVRAHKEEEKQAIKQGKRPFYLKKSEIKKKELAEKFESLKESGKLESFIAKKRQKNAAKDHRYMPYRRTDVS